MTTRELGRLVLKRDILKLRAAFADKKQSQDCDINAYDDEGYTAFIRAVKEPDASLELVMLLLDQGADIHQESNAQFYHGDAMTFALGGGNPEIVNLLIQKGANIRYQKNNYNALLAAVHHRDISSDKRLLDLLRLLIVNGVELNHISSHAESGLRVLSRVGRFDAVKLLLDAGADSSHLKWTPLMHAVATGSLADIKSEVESGASLEDADYWQRTPWLIALQTGDMAKASFLYESGANTGARGRCGKPSLFYAVESNNCFMVKWLLEIGADIQQLDDFGQAALMAAVEQNCQEAVEVLLNAGANLDAEWNGQTALSSFRTRKIGLVLLAAGADPRHLSSEGQRVLLGLEPDANPIWLDASPDEFRQGRLRRFGTGNPEQFHNKFYESMIRAGISGYHASEIFRDSVESTSSPTWCAKRFGQSITFLPDGGIIQIAGEHEDYYHPDFCIYNDVFVHHPNGTIDVFGYPKAIFPPTDFHTASFLGEQSIWIIGSLGYAGTRCYGKTPVYRLDTQSMQMEEIETTGDNPGWIFSHTAIVLPGEAIQISGGQIVTMVGDSESHDANTKAFVLDTKRRMWRVEANSERQSLKD